MTSMMSSKHLYDWNINNFNSVHFEPPPFFFLQKDKYAYFFVYVFPVPYTLCQKVTTYYLKSVSTLHEDI